jgi:hypothetical protein
MTFEVWAKQALQDQDGSRPSRFGLSRRSKIRMVHDASRFGLNRCYEIRMVHDLRDLDDP